MIPYRATTLGGRRATADIEQRKEAYWKAPEIAMAEVPAAILNSGAAFDRASNSVHNVVRFNRGDLFYEHAWVTN